MDIFMEKRVLERVNVDPDDMISQRDASKILGMTTEGVRSAMEYGKLPIMWRMGSSRRMTLRSEVEKLAEERDKG